MKRGTIYWINLEPAQPPEFGKLRPGVIVSNTEHNLRLPTVVVVPLSTQSPEIWPLRLKLELKKGKTSYAIVPGLRQVSKTRLHEVLGLAPQAFMIRLEEAISVYLGEHS